MQVEKAPITWGIQRKRKTIRRTSSGRTDLVPPRCNNISRSRGETEGYIVPRTASTENTAQNNKHSQNRNNSRIGIARQTVMYKQLPRVLPN
jgi:hypothetical protein